MTTNAKSINAQNSNKVANSNRTCEMCVCETCTCGSGCKCGNYN